MSGADIIFTRTHRFGDGEDRLAGQLERFFGSGNVAICVDESRGPVDTGRWPKSSLTSDRVLEMVGKPIPQDWGWRMGDLCHIAIAEDFGPRANQWLVENDVHVPDGSEHAIFGRLSRIEADFMACNLTPKKIKPIAEAVTIALPSAEMGCVFAFNRLAGFRVPELSEVRRQISRGLAGAKRSMPNDEAVVANLGTHSGWRMVDLYRAAPEVFAPAWFDTNPPMLREALDRAPAGSIRLTHPVLSFDQVMRRVQQHAAEGHPQKYKPGRMRRILRALSPGQRRELEAALEQGEGPSQA